MKILYYNGPFSIGHEASAVVDYSGHSNGPLPLTLFTDSSLWRNGQPLFVPPCAVGGTLWVAPAVRIGRLGKYILPKWVYRHIDGVGLVVRLRPEGVQPGEPQWAGQEAFDSSLCVGRWRDFPYFAPHLPEMVFNNIFYASAPLSSQADPTLMKLEGVHTSTIDMESLVPAVSELFTLKSGDVIAAGEIKLGNVADFINHRVVMTLDEYEILRFKVK